MGISIESMSSLRAEYASDAVSDLAAMARMLDRLEQEPGDRHALRELMSSFHSFAGTGGTFGFPALSETGSEGELAALRILARDAPLLPAERQDLGRLVACLRRQLTEDRPAPDEASEVGERRRPSVLVVTNDEILQESLLVQLDLDGFDARLAAGEGLALAGMRAGLPDLLLSDSELPAGAGYRVVEALRQLPKGDQPAVMVLGPRSGRADRSAAIYCGADAVLDRPADGRELARHVGELYASRRRAGRILSVDDDPLHAAFVRSVLEDVGYEVRCCADPSLFTDALDELRPHLLLMDVLLPGASGYDLVRCLRDSQAYAGLPVLFLTTEGQIGARIQSVRAGGDDHLVKPVSPSLLVSAVEARIERSRQLRILLERDGLTRLLTQSAFLDRARALTASTAPDSRCQAAWAMIDLDHFKSINDTYGHPTGDRVLAGVAEFLRSHVRARDVVGRYGGEEMALIFEGLPPSDVVRLVDRLRGELSRLEFEAPGRAPFRITFSAGVAALRPAMSWEDWREAADQALYAAKAAGRNRVELAPDPGGDLRALPARRRARQAHPMRSTQPLQAPPPLVIAS
jgi:diguanylate cyclase (GGDEF)-like protein